MSEYTANIVPTTIVKPTTIVSSNLLATVNMGKKKRMPKNIPDTQPTQPVQKPTGETKQPTQSKTKTQQPKTQPTRKKWKDSTPLLEIPTQPKIKTKTQPTQPKTKTKTQPTQPKQPKQPKTKPLMSQYTITAKLPHTELIIGRSGSGKTVYLLRQLESIMDNNPSLKNIFIVCPTIDDNKAYTTWNLTPNLKKKVHYIGCDQNNVNDEIQDILIKCKKDKGNESELKHLVVLDDCASGKDVKGKSSSIVTLAFGSRHIGLGIIVITQQLTSIAKPFRDNLSRVVCFYTQSRQGLKLLFDEFLGNTSLEERNFIIHQLKSIKYSKLVVDLCYPFSYNVY